MPDTPDFSRYLPGSVNFALTDMGELASRLGSPICYDRRGEFLYFNNFGFGIISDEVSQNGADGSYGLSSLFPFRWPYHFLAVNPKTGQKRTTIQKRIVIPQLNKVGCEWGICVYNNTDYLLVEIEYSNSINAYLAAVRFNFSGSVLEYLNTAGSYIPFATLHAFDSPNYDWHSMKLVIDINARKYSRFLFNNLSYDMASFSLHSEAASYFNSLASVVIAYGNAVDTSNLGISHFLITNNE